LLVAELEDNDIRSYDRVGGWARHVHGGPLRLSEYEGRQNRITIA